ncbi:MAG: Ldh family oxidoreductase [Chloroflexi bacterium]|nr:Ldh family oxidoreductase [Chloroflexota bacterium]
MSDQNAYLPVDFLQAFVKDCFIAFGTAPDDAQICAEVLLESDLRGIESHGVGRLRYYYDRLITGQHNVHTQIDTIRESPTTAVLDGNHGLGMVIGKYAMNLAIEKARTYGLGAVAVRNSTHFGIAGYYPSMAVAEGMVGLTFTNARPSVSPTFGTMPMMGTNPIAFGAPTDELFPFLFDAATPIVQRGLIERLMRAEKPAQEGWLVDPQNNYLTDPPQIIAALTKGEAAFLPLGGIGEDLGGHKGYGLASIVEILSASFQTGAFLLQLSGVNPDGSPGHFKVGHFFMALNVESFVDLETFKHTTGSILRELRASRKAPGQERIFTAGEKEYEKSLQVRKDGVELNPNLQKDLKFVRDKLGLTQYEFPF